MKKGILLFFVMLLATSSFAMQPDEKVAETILNRVVMLSECSSIPFSVNVNDAVLDTTARSFFSGCANDTPVANKVVHNNGQNTNVFRDGIPFDIAMRREDAAEIARYYFGRPAPLSYDADWLYGMTADGVSTCYARFENMKTIKAGILLAGSLMCHPTPDEKAIKEGSIKTVVKPSSKAPLGWEIIRFDIRKNDKESASYRNERFGYSVNWRPYSSLTIREADNGNGITLSDTSGLQVQIWGVNNMQGEKFYDVLQSGLDHFDKIEKRYFAESQGWFSLQGQKGEKNQYMKCFYTPNKNICLLAVYLENDDPWVQWTAASLMPDLNSASSNKDMAASNKQAPFAAIKLLSNKTLETNISVPNDAKLYKISFSQDGNVFVLRALRDMDKLSFHEVDLKTDGSIEPGKMLWSNSMNKGDVCVFKHYLSEGIPNLIIKITKGDNHVWTAPSLSGKDSSFSVDFPLIHQNY